MGRFLFLFFLCLSALLATVNEPFRIELFSGYRSDRLHWHLQEAGEPSEITYREVYPQLSFWENGLVLKTIYRDLLFALRGSYGAFGNGTLHQRYSNLSYTCEKPQFDFHTQGWAADASCYFGYAVNLTAERTYQVILSPLIGVSGHFEHLRRGHSTPAFISSDQAIGATSYTLESSLPGHLKQTWYGLFLGGAFLVRPGGRLSFQVGYFYNWLHLKFQNQMTTTVSFTPTTVSGNLTEETVSASRKGNLGQTGWLQGDVAVSKDWKVGVGGMIRYYSSQVLDAKIQTTVSNETQKLKVRWTQIAGWVQVSREF